SCSCHLCILHSFPTRRSSDLGFKPELFMTIGVVILGIILYKTLPKWGTLYDKFPSNFTFNHMYNTGLVNTENASNKLTNVYMTGSIRSYMIYIFISFVGIMCFALIEKDAFTIDTSNLAPFGLYEVVLVLIIVIASFTILIAKSRLISIIALGAVGYTVSLIFVLFRAPDLVLTQLVIETISVALFLLVFYRLPRMNRRVENRKFKL